jgi:CheY-like chemotaxis protein
MPDMDGSQVACQLREDPRTKNIPVMFLTCLYTKREEHSTGHVLGANLFLAKPYEPAELLKEIEHVIGKGSS